MYMLATRPEGGGVTACHEPGDNEGVIGEVARPLECFASKNVCFTRLVGLAAPPGCTHSSILPHVFLQSSISCYNVS